MRFNRKRFYFSVGFLMLILCACLTLSTYIETRSLAEIAENNSTPSSDFIPSKPIEADPENNDHEDDGSEEQPKERLKVYRNAYKLWDYSNNIYENGLGYRCAMTQVTQVPIFGKQETYYERQKCGDQSYDICFNRAESKLLVNDVITEYTTDAEHCIVYSVRTDMDTFKKSVDFTKTDWFQTYENSFANYVLTKRGRNSHTMNLTINENTAKVLAFSSTNSQYYIKFEMDPSSVGEAYYGALWGSGNFSRIDCASMIIEFHISKTTGYLQSYTIDEIYEVVVSNPLLEKFYKGTISCSAYSLCTFNSMNAIQTIENPFEKYQTKLG